MYYTITETKIRKKIKNFLKNKLINFFFYNNISNIIMKDVQIIPKLINNMIDYINKLGHQSLTDKYKNLKMLSPIEQKKYLMVSLLPYKNEINDELDKFLDDNNIIIEKVHKDKILRYLNCFIDILS